MGGGRRGGGNPLANSEGEVGEGARGGGRAVTGEGVRGVFFLEVGQAVEADSPKDTGQSLGSKLFRWVGSGEVGCLPLLLLVSQLYILDGGVSFIPLFSVFNRQSNYVCIYSMHVFGFEFRQVVVYLPHYMPCEWRGAE